VNAEALKTAIEAMPPDVRNELERMRSEKRGLFGKATTQTIVDRHLELLVWFRKEHQAEHSDLAILLHLHGISGADDQPLTVGTVSSAISRAVKAAGRVKTEPENRVTPESRLSSKRSSAAPAATPRHARRRLAVGAEAKGLGSTVPAARMPTALEPVALTPVTEARARRSHDPELHRADHARLVTLIDPTQED
jgi:hypothetical protein